MYLWVYQVILLACLSSQRQMKMEIGILHTSKMVISSSNTDWMSWNFEGHCPTCYCDLTWQMAEHHTVVRLLSPFSVGWRENWKEKKRKVELIGWDLKNLYTKIKKIIIMTNIHMNLRNKWRTSNYLSFPNQCLASPLSNGKERGELPLPFRTSSTWCHVVWTIPLAN